MTKRNDEEMIMMGNKLADLAGGIAREYFRKRLLMNTKDDRSLVTEVDTKIELALRNSIRESFPEHSVMGEEMPTYQTLSPYTWVIDPIDGTSSFACGKPTFCILIALLHEGIPIMGIIDQPILGERWLGVTGQPTRLNGKPCMITPSGESDRAIRMNCTTPAMFSATEALAFDAVATLASVISYGGDAYAYGLLACGYIDIIVEADLKFYDVAAIIPVLQGAGAIIRTWSGNTITRENFDGRVLAAREHALYNAALARLASQWE